MYQDFGSFSSSISVKWKSLRLKTDNVRQQKCTQPLVKKIEACTTHLFISTGQRLYNPYIKTHKLIKHFSLDDFPYLITIQFPCMYT